MHAILWNILFHVRTHTNTHFDGIRTDVIGVGPPLFFHTAHRNMLYVLTNVSMQISAFYTHFFTLIFTGAEMTDFESLFKAAVTTQEAIFKQSIISKNVAKSGALAAAALKPLLLARHPTRASMNKAHLAAFRKKVRRVIWTKQQKSFYTSASGPDTPNEMTRLRKNMVQHIYDIFEKILNSCYGPKIVDTADIDATKEDDDDQEEAAIMASLQEDSQELYVGIHGEFCFCTFFVLLP